VNPTFRPAAEKRKKKKRGKNKITHIPKKPKFVRKGIFERGKGKNNWEAEKGLPGSSQESQAKQ